MNAIEVTELSKQWGQTKAVNGISFNIEEGEVFGFLGPNGAGKTTTIKMLVGLAKPTGGTAKVAGYDVVEKPRMVKKHIGVVPEQSNLYDELTVYENLRFVSKLYHIPSTKIDQRINELLETFKLKEYTARRFRKLSKGLKRRTVLAAALLHEPEIVFMDEPTSGLDVLSARSLRDLISGLADSGVTIFLTTHYIEEAGQLCDRIALLVRGDIVELDTPEALRSHVHDTPIIEISYNGEELTPDDLQTIKATDIKVNRNKLSIRTENIDRALSEFIKIVEEKGAKIQDVQTIKPGLEDAFIQLTGLSLDHMEREKEGKR